MAVELTCPAVARVAGPVRPIATSDGTVRGYTTGASTDVAHQNSRAPSLDDTGHALTVGSRHPVNRRNNQSGQQDLSVFRPRADAVPPTGRYADVPVCGGVAPDQAPENITPSPRVRSTDPVIVELLKEGGERSKTFRALLDTIGKSRVFVYVESGYCAFGHLNGCLLSYIASSHGDRYLRILVSLDKSRRSHDQLIAVIGHELRHSVEVIEHEGIVDAATLEALYRRIGTPLGGSLRGYETSAARAAEDAVLSELSTPRAGGLVAPIAANHADQQRLGFVDVQRRQPAGCCQ